ncbi:MULTISPECIES: hypothetical protein [Bacteroides]|uniref:hypothetical protein n=1 Tax=Bacteroides TaxID=816 RepID=UPI000AE46156|nr:MULTISPECIES: hypothetical protein [Bacteroides]MDC7283595.1 hypothetical protein [Bacteroides caccae]MDU3579238.1 hypothetical protein [Bacteroides caccae]MDU3628622.1 hypothetical protein [Bacteroides caccae]MDU3671104.1 hypothetical protein [Bacteroides caccae]QQT78639.1 hypothetical protein I6I54_02425 [Bacteroides caccae]
MTKIYLFLKCSRNTGINTGSSVLSDYSLPYKKTKILFQPITYFANPFIHHAFRTVIGCLQPITSSITYHLLIWIKSTVNESGN